MKNKSIVLIAIVFTFIGSYIQAGKKTAAVGGFLGGMAFNEIMRSNRRSHDHYHSDCECNCKRLNKQLSKCEHRLDKCLS